jgi:dienelactone hydrolase
MVRDADVAAAVSFLALRAQPDVDDHRIAVTGRSMGDEQALGAAEDAVVRGGRRQRVAARRVRGPGCTQQRIDWLTFALAGLFTDAQPPTILRGAAATMPPRPVLLITAGSVADEGRAAAWIREARPRTVQVWSVDEADQRRRTGDRARGVGTTVTAFPDASGQQPRAIR